MTTLIDKLNTIHKAWMDLSSDDPQSVQDTVIRAMELNPSIYISVNSLGYATIMDHGSPRMSATPLDEVLAIAKHTRVQTDILWASSGKWFTI